MTSQVVVDTRIGAKSSALTPKYDTHYFLQHTKYPFLRKETSSIQCNQVRSISIYRIERFMGQLDSDDLQRVLDRLLNVFVSS